MFRIALAACLFLAAACGEASLPEPPRTPPEDTLVQPPVRPAPPALSLAAAETVAELRATAEAGTLRGLARRADAEDGFLSNFADESHFAHWDLLRRTGVDPNAKLLDLFEEPYAVTQAGAQSWYVWPDLAVLPPEDLIPEKLSFIDRARLLRLVGEEGIDVIRRGGDYPGFRTAISQDGRWLYFVHEIDA